VLSNEVVDFDEEAAAAVSAIITVPKPSAIRLFRGCEPQGDILGSSESAVVSPPLIVHDIAVLSYKGMPANIQLSLATADSSSVLKSVVTTGDINDVTNWILYSNEISTPAIGDQHDTTLNEFLTIGGEPTDFILSGFGMQDGGYATAIGMKAIHMAMYFELPSLAEPAADFVVTSGPAGCSFLVLADPPED
jgi:hypothetical protein